MASFAKMSQEEWNALPSSTNAVESLHWKFYVALGKDHDLLGGLEALHAIAEHFERKYTSCAGWGFPSSLHSSISQTGSFQLVGLFAMDEQNVGNNWVAKQVTHILLDPRNIGIVRRNT